MLEFPGLVDAHVHLREPGATHKEDFESGTAAALAGGFTSVLAMPNTQPPITNDETLAQARRSAQSKARCDYGIFLGAGEDNAHSAAQLVSRVCGLKMYLDQTYGPLRLEGMRTIQEHMTHWPAGKPIVAHAEGRSLATILLFAALFDQRVHIAHVSLKEEILLIKAAKEKGIPVTCEVTPHHLFLTEDDVGGIGSGRGEVRPRLASETDRQALWDNFSVIDCIASDHAPHTLEEKDSENPPPGFPGLETALPLMLGAVSRGRITLDELISRMHSNPARIFGLAPQQDTHIEVDADAVWEVQAETLHTRCGWTPFEGMKLKGRVRRVYLRGQLAFKDGFVRVPPGYGIELYPGLEK